MKNVLKTALFAAATAGLGLSSARAGAVYDLRIVAGPTAPTADGKNVIAPLPGAYTLKLYGRVDGANGNNLDEGLGSGFVSILSGESGGGLLADDSGIAGPGAITAGWNGTGSAAGGPAADVNGDGIFDIGTAVTNTSATGQVPPRFSWRTVEGSGRSFLNTPSVGAATAVDANTAEFELGTFTINVTGPLGLGVTTFSPVVPTRLAAGVSAVGATVDAILFSVPPTGTVTPGQSPATPPSSSVSFMLPEPASLSLLALAALGLLRRCRQS